MLCLFAYNAFNVLHNSIHHLRINLITISFQMAPSMKPQLRGLLHSQIKTNLIVAIGLSIVGGIAYKVLVNDPQKQKYLDYYK